MQVSASQQLAPAIFSRGPTSNGDSVSDKVLETHGSDESETRNEPQQLTASTRKNAIAKALTADELSQLRLLKNRDREVRAHEQAHAIVGGPYTGAPNYQYTTGPDGQQYASSGHVNIDSSKISGDPKATLQKALQLKRAALAPAQPSQQDRRVAANAQKLAIEARADLNALLLDAQPPRNSTASGSTIDTFA